jgi:hypothetical protein
MEESTTATWSIPFARLGASAFTVKEKTVMSVLFETLFAVIVYRVGALTLVGVPLMVQ